MSQEDWLDVAASWPSVRIVEVGTSVRYTGTYQYVP